MTLFTTSLQIKIPVAKLYDQRARLKTKQAIPKLPLEDVCTVVIMMTRKKNYKNKGRK